MSAALERLLKKLDASTAQMGVVGLGHVGLPVACMLASTDLQVIGVDLKPDRVRMINAGRSPLMGDEPGLAELLSEVVALGRLHATTEPAQLATADVVLVSVETPVDSEHRPNYDALCAACRSLGVVMAEGALVIIESTLAPGTMEMLVRPLLEAASGRECGKGFFLGYCPERVMPGRLLINLRSMSRVIGAQTSQVGEVMRRVYRRYVEAELDVTDLITAELVKTVENAYRDVNIALANQVALICEAVGANAWEVRDLVNKCPGRDMLLPGAGVGGHCIPKDPWLLVSGLPSGKARVIEAAREMNDFMPEHMTALTLGLLEESQIPPSEAVVAVLGASYLPDSGDTRNSPTAPLVRGLTTAGCAVRVHDPHVPGQQDDLGAVVRGADVLVVMVGHSAYRNLDLHALGSAMRHRLLVDGRHIFSSAQLGEAGFTHRTIGVSALGAPMSAGDPPPSQTLGERPLGSPMIQTE